MVEQETQTDDPREAVAEIQTQTEDIINKVAITQTHSIEYNDEDCQTDIMVMFSAEVQADIKPQTSEMGTEPDAKMVADMLKEMEDNMTKD